MPTCSKKVILMKSLCFHSYFSVQKHCLFYILNFLEIGIHESVKEKMANLQDLKLNLVKNKICFIIGDHLDQVLVIYLSGISSLRNLLYSTESAYH